MIAPLAPYNSRITTHQPDDADLRQSGEDAASEEQRGELLAPDVPLQHLSEEVQHDTVEEDVEETVRVVCEDGRDPRPDAGDVIRLEDEQFVEQRHIPHHVEDDDFRDKRPNHQRKEHERHVPAEVAQRAAGAGGDTESTATVVRAVIEATVEHSLRVVPLIQPRTGVILRESVLSTERPAAHPALVRHILVLPTHVALRHCSMV